MNTGHPFVELLELPSLQGTVIPLDAQTSAEAVCRLGERFVARPDSSWWWEHVRDGLPRSTHVPPNDDGYLLIPTVCPDQPVLFFVSDDTPPPWPAYLAKPSDLARALAECPPFEYVVADPGGGWLLMENHHGMLVAVGEPVSSALARHAA
jgi:hypothetical protein